MPKYFYIARNKAGHKLSGMEDASTQEEALTRLQGKNLIVIELYHDQKEISGLKPDVIAKGKFRPRHYRVTSDDLVLLCRQLATLLGAGVTILKSMDIICKQVNSRRLYNTIRDVQKKMESGFSLHAALGKHPGIFSELWVNLVESGEASGNLAVVLSRLANYLERKAAFKRKIISALLYPIILIAAGLIALLFLTIKIIPTFEELFKGFDVTLPLLTRMLIMASKFIRSKQFLITLTILLTVGWTMFRKYMQTKEGRRRYEKFLLGLPVFGEFFRILIVERFTSEMATLIESGVPILYSLEITERSVASLVMAEIVRDIKEEVREGRPLNQPLEKSGFFEPMAVQMINIGEEIGELSDMFKRLNIFYQEYVDTFLLRFATLFEPIMLIFVGILIGIMVIGMFMPIFQIANIK